MAASTSPHGVLVIGAGELGTAMLKALVANPHRGSTAINVLLRPSTIETQDPKKKAEIESLKTLDVTLVPGDVSQNSIDELASTFSRFDTIVGCTGMIGGKGLQTRIGEAVLAAKVRKYIPWQFGVDYDAIERISGYNTAGGLFSEQMDVRKMLRGQNTTNWLIISTGMFMSFIFEPSFGIVTEDKCTVHALGSWGNQITLTDVEDIGKVTASVLFEKPELVNQVVFCAGDTIEYRKVVKVLRDMGIDVTAEQWTMEQLKKDLSEDPENQIKKYRVVFASGIGLSWDVEKSYNAEKDMEMMKLQDWVKGNLERHD